MKFYKITLRSVPRIIFAYSVTSERYKNSFPSFKDLLEISVIESGTILYDHADGTHSATPPGTLAPILKDMHCKTYTEPGVLQKHITVGTVADYDCRLCDAADVSELEALKLTVRTDGVILLPYQWDLGHRYREIAELLRQIEYSYTSMHETHLHDTLAKWFHLTGLLTEIVLNRLEGRSITAPPACTEYVRHAKLYIAEHFRERITVSDIAARLGISEGYLHAIFRRETGFSIVQYVNHFRVNTVKQYLSSRDITLQEAAAEVGVDDPAYMSRLFKRIEGVSFREYRKQAAHFEP